MGDSLRNKVRALLQSLERRYDRVKWPAFLPPPSSADAAAAQAVSFKNSEIVAGAVLGLHGPPLEGVEAARRLMSGYVDWNEVRVSNPVALTRVLGRDPRAVDRLLVLQRFLEAFFLRQRNLNLDYLVNLKLHERKQFLANLEVFNREELAAVLLTCFGLPAFPVAEACHRVAQRCGLVKARTTLLQMAKELEDCLEADELLNLYSHLYSVAWQTCHVEHPKCPQCPLRLKCPAAKQFAKGKK